MTYPPMPLPSEPIEDEAPERFRTDHGSVPLRDIHKPTWVRLFFIGGCLLSVGLGGQITLFMKGYLPDTYGNPWAFFFPLYTAIVGVVLIGLAIWTWRRSVRESWRHKSRLTEPAKTR